MRATQDLWGVKRGKKQFAKRANKNDLKKWTFHLKSTLVDSMACWGGGGGGGGEWVGWGIGMGWRGGGRGLMVQSHTVDTSLHWGLPPHAVRANYFWNAKR